MDRTQKLFKQINLGRQALASKENGETGGGLNRLIRIGVRAVEALFHSYQPFAFEEIKKFRFHSIGALKPIDLDTAAMKGLKEAINSYKYYDSGHASSFEKHIRKEIIDALRRGLLHKTVWVHDDSVLTNGKTTVLFSDPNPFNLDVEKNFSEYRYVVLGYDVWLKSTHHGTY